MGEKNDIKKNASGYTDPTAYEAISKISSSEKRLNKLMATIFYVVDLAGFHLEERLVLKDKYTGEIFR